MQTYLNADETVYLRNQRERCHLLGLEVAMNKHGMHKKCPALMEAVKEKFE